MKRSHVLSPRWIAILGSLAWVTLPAVAADAPKEEPKTDVSKSSQVEEVNVAAVARGAKVEGSATDASNLLAMIDQTQGTPALLSPSATSGASVSVIDLAAATEVTRIALQVGSQKGKLRIIALDDERAVEAAQKSGKAEGKLISEFTLDGTQNNLSLTLEKLTMKSVAVVWLPETPGQALAVSAVGIFTRNPPPEAALKTSSADSAVSVAGTSTSASKGTANSAPSASSGSSVGSASSGGNTNASSSVVATTPTVTPPEAIPPQTKVVSAP